jgi:hypothetical protein
MENNLFLWFETARPTQLFDGAVVDLDNMVLIQNDQGAEYKR